MNDEMITFNSSNSCDVAMTQVLNDFCRQ